MEATDIAKEAPGFIELLRSSGSAAQIMLIWVAIKIKDHVREYLDTQKRMHEQNSQLLREIHRAVNAKSLPLPPGNEPWIPK